MSIFFSKDEKKIVIYSLIVLLIAMFPIFSAGVYYLDDAYRAVSGKPSMVNQGRPLANFILSLFSSKGRLLDISPGFHIISIMEMSIFAVVMRRIFPALTVLSSVVAMLLVFLCPFYIQNISYKYDVVTMTTANLFSVISIYVVFCKKNTIVTSFIFGVVCFLSMLTTYQVALNMAIVFFLTKFFSMIKEDVYFLIKRSICYILAMVLSLILYKVSLPLWFTPTWYSAYSSESLMMSDLFQGVISNFMAFYVFILKTLGKYYIVGSACLFLLFCVGYIKASSNKISSLIILTVFSVFLCLCIPGVMLVLKHPPIEPRVLSATGAVLASLFILSISSNAVFFKKISVIVVIFMIFKSAVLFMAYGNVLSMMSKDIDFYINSSIDKLNEISRKEKINKFTIRGVLRDSRYIESLKHANVLFDYIIPPELGVPYSFYYNVKIYSRNNFLEYVEYNDSGLNANNNTCNKLYDGGWFLINKDNNLLIIEFPSY